MNTVPATPIGPVLGIDPGATSGALVLLAGDGRRVLWWLAYWSRRSGAGGYLLAGVDHEGSATRETGLLLAGELAQAACDALAPEGWSLCVEKTFAGEEPSAESILTLGEACGEIVGAVAHRHTPRLPRPRAREDWRPMVLGIRRGKAQGSEAQAVQLVPSMFAWPERARFEKLSKVPKGATCEAACIALYGLLGGSPIRHTGSRLDRTGDRVTVPWRTP